MERQTNTIAHDARQHGFMMRMRKRMGLFRKRDDGVAAVEFAMIMAPFFALLLAIFEVGIHYFVETTLQSGVDSVARQVRTGEIRGGATVEADFKQALCNESANGML
ncbi:MAG: TadE/TadG family type IV pilus assembly protein, partial [Pseudomonadota bacterium]